MKITDNLVYTINARLADLRFELQAIGMLETIETEPDLKEQFDSVTPETVLTEDDPEELHQMRMLKSVMKDMNVTDSNGVIAMIEKRSQLKLSDMDDVKDLYHKTEDDVKNILQTDLVVQYLEGLGLSENTRIEIDFIKTSKIQELAKVLAIKDEELK
jgi:hypothetical protein